MVGLFGIVEDDALLGEILSFCDFHGAIAVGGTCSRLKCLSDAALDKWAGLASTRQKPGKLGGYPHPHDIASRFITDFKPKEMWVYSAWLKRGWDGCHSKRSLIEYALKRHGEELASYLRRREDYDENRARHDLQGRGAVHIRHHSNIQKWCKMSIEHYNLSLGSAASKIADHIVRLDIHHDKFDDVTDEENELRHFAFCLLKKSDPTSIMFSHVQVERNCHYDRWDLSTDWVIMFLVEGIGEIEFGLRGTYRGPVRSTVAASDMH